MSILKPNPPYDLFEEVNVGRREFIVQEDHSSETPFSKKMLIGFGGIILAAVLLFTIGYMISDSNEHGIGELPYLSSVYSVLGQERHVVEKSLRSSGAKVIYDPGIDSYRLRELVDFANYQFNVLLLYDGNDRLRSAIYMMPVRDGAEPTAAHVYELMESTQDAWGCSRDTIFSRNPIKYEYSDLEEAFAGDEQWSEEITWIVSKDISDLGFEEGDCISIRFHADNPGSTGMRQIWFKIGIDTAETEDFVYDPGVFGGRYA